MIAKPAYCRCFWILSIAVLCSAVLSVASQPQTRIHSQIDEDRTFILRGTTHPAVTSAIAQDLGRVPASQPMPRMYLHFALSPSQQSDLSQFLKSVQDRRSPQYRQFLSPEQYAERFGLHTSDLARITAWLEQRGFSNLQVARSKTWVSFSGTAAQAEAAFRVNIHRFALKGKEHIANADDPQLPKAFERVISALRGLHNFTLKPRISHQHPHLTLNRGDHYLAPDDWTTIYNVKPVYGQGWDGTGVTIAVVGQSDVRISDITAFRLAAGLPRYPSNNPEVIIPPGSQDPGIQNASGDENESDLDLEWAGAIAPNASLEFITASAQTGNGVEDALTYAIDNNVAPIITTSYGACEADQSTALSVFDKLFQQANAQGITIVAASGDAGAADCDTFPEGQATMGPAVDFPASSEFVTGVGGTTFNEGQGHYWSSINNADNGSALSYIPEVAWNDGFQSATGGGASTLVAKPYWQAGTGVPDDGQRDVPDLAFAASMRHDGYVICGDGSCTNGFRDSDGGVFAIGGTSADAPTFAGLLALVIQSDSPNTRLGNINPNLYSLAQISPAIFHDVTYGDNDVDCQTGTAGCPNGSFGFNAQTGYDQATGWGSVDASALVDQWYGDIQISASTSNVQLQPGGSSTAQVTVNPHQNFSGTVSLSCTVASTLVGVTCSIPNGTVNTSGTVNVIITAAATAHAPPPLKLPRSWPGTPGGWLISCSLLALLSAALFSLAKPSPRRLRYTCAAGSLFLVAFAMGAVGCGSGGSSLTVNTPVPTSPALAISCNIPVASTGAAYSGSCNGTGGTGSLTYSISAGALPAGLNLNTSTGTISGVPTVPGSTSFTVQVSDTGSPVQTAKQAISNFTVAARPLSLTCNLPSAAAVAVTLSGICIANGGTPPLNYAISAGTLPPGLVLNASSGSITGTPTIAGSYSFTVTVTDSATPGQTASHAITNFSVAPAAPANPLFMACNLQAASLGAPYSANCSASGGETPYTYSITAGSLPAGLTLGTATGIIGGTPSAQGTTSFTVQATDTSSPKQAANQSVNLTVGPRLSETGLVTVVAVAGSVVNTLTISVTVP